MLDGGEEEEMEVSPQDEIYIDIFKSTIWRSCGYV